MAGHQRSVDAQWEAEVAELIERRLDATTTAERDLAGQLLLDLLIGRPAYVEPPCPQHNDVSPPARALQRDTSRQV
jgi:hypothetical protein